MSALRALEGGSGRVISVSSSGALSSADTMSVHGAEQESARCFRFFPTGKQCLRFYITIIITLMGAVVSTVVLVSGAVSDQKDLECTFQTMLATCIAYWMQPPSL